MDSSFPGHIPINDLLNVINALRQGDTAAAEQLSGVLWNPIHLAVVRILGDDSLDKDDVTQDSLLAALDYFKRDVEFKGDPVKLAVTIARNRCIDILRKRTNNPEVDLTPMADWIADPGSSALDDLEQSELYSQLQKALNQISESCGRLLRSLYLQKTSTEVIRQQLGLKSVHAVYYRREVCLQEAKKFLQRSLVFRSGNNGGRGSSMVDGSEVME